MKTPRRLDPNAWWLLAAPAALGLILISVDVLFLGLAIFCGIGWIVTITERDEIVVKWGDEIFTTAGVKHKNKLLTAVNVKLLDSNRELKSDYDAVVRRLAEVLDEHSLCPLPITDAPDPDFGIRLVANIRAHERQMGRRS